MNSGRLWDEVVCFADLTTVLEPECAERRLLQCPRIAPAVTTSATRRLLPRYVQSSGFFSSDVCPQMASEDWMRAIRSLVCDGALTSIHLPPSSRRMPGTPAGNLNSARVSTQGLAEFRLSLRCLSSR
jgi:hypothetical protein